MHTVPQKGKAYLHFTESNKDLGQSYSKTPVTETLEDCIPR